MSPSCHNCGEGNLIELHDTFTRCLSCGFDSPSNPNANPHPEPLMSSESLSAGTIHPRSREDEGSEAPPNVDPPAEGPLPGTPLFPDFNPPSPLDIPPPVKASKASSKAAS